MAETNAKQAIGTKAAIGIEATAEGEMLISVDLCGQAMGKSPTLVQCLALTGVEAIREAIRETLSVKSEQIVHGADAKDPIH